MVAARAPALQQTDPDVKTVLSARFQALNLPFERMQDGDGCALVCDVDSHTCSQALLA